MWVWEQWQNSLTPNLEVVKHLHVYTCNLKHSHINKTFIKLMTSWIQGMYMSKHSAIKFVNIRYHVNKNLIKQVQSLKNDYNEHLASVHPDMQIKSNHLWLLACPTHNQCKIHEVYAARNKILLGHKCEVLKTYSQYLKVLKKCYKALR